MNAPRNFNRAAFISALIAACGLKGEYAATLDPHIEANLQLLDVSDTPFLRFGKPGARTHTKAAVAATNSGLVCSPSQNVALQIEQILIVNETGAMQDFGIYLAKASDIAGLANTGAALQLLDLAAQPDDGGALTNLGSNVKPGTAVGGIGTRFGRVRLLTDTSFLLTFPRPGVILYGNDPNGIPGCAVFTEVVNLAVRATFYAREWPLPG